MIKLGGAITLDGFDELEPAKLVVAKKIIGIYAKKAGEAMGGIQEFLVSRENNSVKVTVKGGERTSEAIGEDSNLFIALSRALSEAEEKAKA